MRKSLVLRADGGSEVGMGHLMRCLALAQAWRKDGARAILVCAEGADLIAERARASGIEVVPIAPSVGTLEDAEATASKSRECAAEWVVVDGYRFASGYVSALQSRSLRVLQVDDMANAAPYVADALLNQNAYAARDAYPGFEGTALLGPAFALLREEFLSSGSRAHDEHHGAARVLVTFGGGDPHNLTAVAVEALAAFGLTMDIEVVVVVGRANLHLSELEARVREHGRFRLVRDASNMAQWMEWADVAICASGSVCLELAYCGVPFLAVVTAPNQRAVAQAFHSLGVALDVGEYPHVDASAVRRCLAPLLGDSHMRVEMAARGQALVDGRGAHRVAAFLERGETSSPVD